MSTNEDPVACVLRNELILKHIFHFRPLKSLLTVSHMNKFRNAEARTYMRDHRKCTVYIKSWPVVPCRELQQLDFHLGGMDVIPFNSLTLHLRIHAEPRSDNNGDNPHKNCQSFLLSSPKSPRKS